MLNRFILSLAKIKDKAVQALPLPFNPDQCIISPKEAIVYCHVDCFPNILLITAMYSIFKLVYSLGDEAAYQDIVIG